jgi:hypothetical protein
MLAADRNGGFRDHRIVDPLVHDEPIRFGLAMHDVVEQSRLKRS